VTATKKLATSIALALVAFSQVQAGAATKFDENCSIGKELNLPVYEWRDTDQPVKGVIVAAHGLTFYGKAFDDFATHLADQGFIFVAPDLRGFGKWKSNPEAYGGDSKPHFTQSKEDLLNILRKVRDKHLGAPVIVLGESLGANYAFWVASSNPELVDGVIVTAPCYKTYWHPRPRWCVDFWKGLLNPKTELPLEPYIRPTLSHDPKVVESVMQDPQICRGLSPVDLVKTAITNRISLKEAGKIPANMPILIIAGKNDQVYKTSSLPQFVQMIGSRKTDVHVLLDKGHLLLEHQAVDPQVTGLVDRWLAKNANGLTVTASGPYKSPEVSADAAKRPTTTVSIPEKTAKHSSPGALAAAKHPVAAWKSSFTKLKKRLWIKQATAPPDRKGA
jgi:alpha-beta hydrolase superfamily lysophospholipase